MKALIFGKSGDLAAAIAHAFKDEWMWDITRVGRDEPVPSALHDAYVFPQGSWLGKPLADSTSDEIEVTIDIGLTTIIKRLRECLLIPVPSGQRIDYVIIGSTSSYQGAPNSSVYCAVKHGLHGLVNSLNKEYKATNRRFWLCSMGTMDAGMGREIDAPEEITLNVIEVAQRIVSAVTNRSNLFEPDLIIRGRHQ